MASSDGVQQVQDGPPERWLGIDVGVHALHLAVLGADGGLRLDVAAPDGLAAFLDDLDTTDRPDGGTPPLAGAAVDSPADWADDAHRDDERVAPKFRHRCAEAVLARRDPPHFVSWPSPGVDDLDAAAHGWVAVGIEVHRTLERHGVPVDECWPHASWQRLSGRRTLPRKTSRDGLALRRAVLVEAGVDGRPLATAGHDHLDAAVAALTAATVDDAERRRAACPDHDHPASDRGIVLPTRSRL